ncbi:MAG: DUF4388 domain-containing protein [Proteobacteria bacterium]|nr:DUF4388 domain-containing protein [Pseudomonadota bacterium]
MKLLCVVNRYLQKFLTEGFRGMTLTFCVQWDEAAHALAQSRFDMVIIHGEAVEDEVLPILLWSAASQLRLLGTKGIFIGLSLEGGRVLSQYYPTMKQIAYPSSAAEFFLDMQQVEPGMFTDSTISRTGSSGLRHQRLVRSVLPVDGPSSVLGVRRDVSQMSRGRSAHPTLDAISSSPVRKSLGSLAEMSSIPLGLRASSVSNHSSVPASKRASQHDQPVEDTSSSDIMLVMSDISSSSGLDLISSSEMAIEQALMASSDDNIVTQNGPEERRHIEASASAMREKPYDPMIDTMSSMAKMDDDQCVVVQRTQSEAILGKLEFGTLMRVVVLLMRLGRTGVLEVKNESRRIHIEYKNGKTFSNSQLSLIESAFMWESGEFNFNEMALLSRDCTPIDVDEIITRVVHKQLSLNQILRTLGFELRHFILVTDCFNEENHKIASYPWWKSCLGETHLNDVMGSGNMPMDVLARDIYRAWICDEVTFTDTASDKPAKVVYASNPRVNQHDRREKSRLSLDASNDSHLRVIREDLIRIKNKFECSDGYAILGLKQGCGTKALDDAYYAWINRYHTDRFVRYKDPTLVQLANDLVMMMNNIYPRLSKSERIGVATAQRNASPATSANAFESGLGSPRIGSSRHRLSTLDISSKNNDKLNQVSQELKSLQAADKEHVKQSGQRVYIRPASNSNNVSVPRHIRTPRNEQRPVKRMNEMLVDKQGQSQLRNLKPARSSAPGDRVSVSNAAIRPIQQVTTPEQYFQTGRKKLLLDLIPEAIEAFQMAVRGDPQNREYIVNFIYAKALQIPQKRDIALEKLKEFYMEAEHEYSTSPDDKNTAQFVFILYYYCGKIELLLDRFEEARDDFTKASKVNPADIDTQRCLRFIQQHLGKKQQVVKPKEGFIHRLKDSLNKNL